MALQSTLMCPTCGHVETETMPTDACQFFYGCKGCEAVLRPNAGDGFVLCSFGTVPCAPMQEASGQAAVAPMHSQDALILHGRSTHTVREFSSNSF